MKPADAGRVLIRARGQLRGPGLGAGLLLGGEQRTYRPDQGLRDLLARTTAIHEDQGLTALLDNRPDESGDRLAGGRHVALGEVGEVDPSFRGTRRA